MSETMREGKQGRITPLKALRSALVYLVILSFTKTLRFLLHYHNQLCSPTPMANMATSAPDERNKSIHLPSNEELSNIPAIEF